MLLPGAVGAICGLLLGRRYTVLVLIPAHLVAVLVAAAVAVWLDLGLREAIGTLAVWSLGCEAGFLVAAALALAPFARRRPAPSRFRRAPWGDLGR